MDKKLLCKLGNYFSKGVKVGALTAAVLMGAGCDTLTQDQNTAQTVDYDQDLYSQIFLRHRFVEPGAKITYQDSTKTKVAWANRHFNDAVAYMRTKIADFQQQIFENEPADNFLQPIYNEYFVDAQGKPDDGFSTYTSLDPILGHNTDYRYSEFLGAIAAKSKIVDADGELDPYQVYEVFRTCYSKLAVRAYNDSLGYLKDSPEMPLNQAQAQIDAEVERLNILNDEPHIEHRLNELLEGVSARTGVSLPTLQDAVNLSLLNASLWGAHDLAEKAHFQLTSEDTIVYPTLSTLNYKRIIGNLHVTWDYYRAKYREQEEQAQQAESEQGL